MGRVTLVVVKLIVFALLFFTQTGATIFCECNVKVGCPTPIPGNRWDFWVYPSVPNKQRANDDLFRSRAGWVWAEAADYSMCGPSPPAGYVCTLRSILRNCAPQRFCDSQSKITANYQSYQAARALNAGNYDVWMEAPDYVCLNP